MLSHENLKYIHSDSPEYLTCLVTATEPFYSVTTIVCFHSYQPCSVETYYRVWPITITTVGLLTAIRQMNRQQGTAPLLTEVHTESHVSSP